MIAREVALVVLRRKEWKGVDKTRGWPKCKPKIADSVKALGESTLGPLLERRITIRRSPYAIGEPG